ncbi:MAG: homoserine dehydrogenase [Coriobacteriales bacterium]|jgi:homoserine dehydrogenase|nr:homoserine dehydrogenase [Coriobacteriales bacterium]
MKTIKLGLIGLGTVGGGVVRILQEHHDDFVRDQDIDLRLVAVASRDSSEAHVLGIADIFSTDGNDIINNPEIDIVIELVGGTGAARSFVYAALEAGKSVVTANKALIAAEGHDICTLAASKGCEVAFEASVGGGIPIIGPLRHTLAGNRITSVIGILNGTTNYMLTRIDEDRLSYDAALAEAQAAGFAEFDPTADVEGADAAAKIAILGTIAYNTDIHISQVPVEGITAISPVDLDYAREMGYSIKLLGIANRTPGGIDIRVHPTMLALDHPLSSVRGVMNAIYVVGDAVGETMYYGAGAGSGPAASSVVGDLIEVARHLAYRESIAQPVWDTEALPIRSIDELITSYYLRLSVPDRPGVLATTAQVFAQHDVSIYSMVQRGVHEGCAELIYVTHAARESAIRATLAGIEKTGLLTSAPVLIRVEDAKA